MEGKKIVAVQNLTGELIISDEFIGERIMRQYPLTPSIKQVETETLLQYIHRHKKWSKKTFGYDGLGDRVEGVLKHIEKEINEVRNDPNDLMEAIDILILGFDLAWRMGYTPNEIVSALIEKQNINRERKWPVNVDKDKPTEHIK